jgi:hypothetical protein
MAFSARIKACGPRHGKTPETPAGAALGQLVSVASLFMILVTCASCQEVDDAPDAGPSRAAEALPSAPAPSASEAVEVMPEPRCPPDMVKVTPGADAEVEGGKPEGPFCVDRFEATLVDNQSGARIPPYYPPSRRAAQQVAKMWESLRFEMGSPTAQATPLPTLPAWMMTRDFAPKAVVRRGQTPNGHVSGPHAATACANAKKRLCTWVEWRIACGGERGWQFPYGSAYLKDACNVYREGHPASTLHDNPAIGHSDPRLNLVKVRGKPLLRQTGDTPSCKSPWGDDAIYDMVGNLDEWLDDPEGTFAGGFYSRTSMDGCEKRVRAHPFDYADYSTGVRCCADLP